MKTRPLHFAETGESCEEVLNNIGCALLALQPLLDGSHALDTSQALGLGILLKALTEDVFALADPVPK
jgi:hypothetical protein